MLADRLTPFLLIFLSVWRAPASVSGHPHPRQCRLMQRSALCTHAKFPSVPEDLPDYLEELQLNYNQIKTLNNKSLLHYPSLNTLSLACNNLEIIKANTFLSSKQLKTLNLANNRLDANYQDSGAALKKLLALRSLDLSENRLDNEMASALLENLTSIEYLNLSGNILKRLDETSFRDLYQLKELDLQRNILFEIDDAFNGNPMLQRLNLAFNYLPCLTDFHMTQLLVLNASHNFIEWFISRQDLNDTFQLETLDLSNNKLFFFPFLPSKSNLRNLHLSHNSVSFYEHLSDNTTSPNTSRTVEFYNLKTHPHNVTAELWDEGLHGDISSLEILDLRGNKVEYFPKGFIQKMPLLSRVQMNTNCLETLNMTLERFSSSLYELDVSNNRLTQISMDHRTLATLGNLTYFNLSSNGLERIPSGLFSSLPSIRSVDLSYNGIEMCLVDDIGSSDTASTCENWQSVKSLRQLFIRGCNLRRIPESAFAGLSLTHLELSDNPLDVGQHSLQSLTKTLQHLGLGNTQIRNLDFSAFQSLTFLNLSRNSLIQIPLSLQSIPLRVLDIRDNNLSSISSGLAYALAPKLQTVFLTGNPFNCCQTEWFRTFKATKTLAMHDQSGILCKDIFRTRRTEEWQNFLCEEARESVVWYLLLIVPMCLLVMVVSIITFLIIKPKILPKSIKKKYLKPTSY